jgi:hypothetical protein
MKAKTKKRDLGDKRDDTPLMTIGDLRKRLRSLGTPWEPDPMLSDDDPIPQYPTGGDGTAGAPGELAADEDLDELLTKQGAPPSNVELRKVWRKAKLLDKEPRSKRKLSNKRNVSGDRG